MFPHFLQRTRTAIALVLALSVTAAQAQPDPAQSDPRCDPPILYRSGPAVAAANPCPRGAVCPERCKPGTTCTYPCGDGETCTVTCPPRPTDGETGTRDEPTRPETDDGRRDEDRQHHSALPALLGAIGAAVVTVGVARAMDRQTGPKWASPEQLDADGPRFPVEQQLGRFQVQGYATPGWPFAVDIETQPGTWTWLEMRYKGSDRPQYVDLTHPEGGRRMEVVTLPASRGSLDVARYSLHSALLRRGQKPIYLPLRVYGIGAGPEAVGSLYLSVTNFGPARASSPTAVNWAVSAKRQFQNSRIEVLRLPRQGEERYTAVTLHPINLSLTPQVSGNWGALPMLTTVGPGTYELQARAWRKGASGGDWTGAFSPNYVNIP